MIDIFWKKWKKVKMKAFVCRIIVVVILVAVEEW
jgi:hypothetical protein